VPRALGFLTPLGRALGSANPLLLAVLVSLVIFGVVGVLTLTTKTEARVPPRPGSIAQGGMPAAAPNTGSAARPTPLPQQVQAVAETDTVTAGETFVRALYAGDDDTASLYQPGFGPVLRKTEDEHELQALSARPMSWGEAAYPDADPTSEWVEVVARVRAKKGNGAGNIYYKLGFLRDGDALSLHLWSQRNEVRD